MEMSKMIMEIGRDSSELLRNIEKVWVHGAQAIRGGL